MVAKFTFIIFNVAKYATVNATFDIGNFGKNEEFCHIKLNSVFSLIFILDNNMLKKKIFFGMVCVFVSWVSEFYKRNFFTK